MYDSTPETASADAADDSTVKSIPSLVPKSNSLGCTGWSGEGTDMKWWGVPKRLLARRPILFLPAKWYPTTGPRRHDGP